MVVFPTQLTPTRQIFMILVSLCYDELMEQIIHPFSCGPNDRIARDGLVCGLRHCRWWCLDRGCDRCSMPPSGWSIVHRRQRHWHPTQRPCWPATWRTAMTGARRYAAMH